MGEVEEHWTGGAKFIIKIIFLGKVFTGANFHVDSFEGSGRAATKTKAGVSQLEISAIFEKMNTPPGVENTGINF